ncbi:glucose PTS transporter subunit IIA [Spiroplasma floricola]|uniref:PTS system, beta-glucoside-specific IIABC component n=1 Tax=Spiroplasma floricola 23-6 TaxID=1336749 RepID=A0A2K8SE14_9MOLU|nr:PTS glucose transporter subunit IIABC [Spiroplasma floricola]AUB31691.1 PTS system, beta-glucoside-specific IIABC component [Spiroplasma floricola 23-6]
MEIKIFSPMDGEIKKIEECSDSMFAQKMMGDGFLIVPTSNELYSPFYKGNVAMIFDTKHAVFLESDNLKMLIHVGIDTVSLNGKPFKLNVEQNNKVDLNTKIMTIDFNQIAQKNLVTETPIVFEESNLSTFKIKKLNTGKVKKGDLVALIEYEIKKESQVKKEKIELIGFESKYLTSAKQFIKNVGGFSNFEEVYNCMTRLRFKIIDKEKVDVQKISNNELVKGTVWNGNELQVIIGGECYKVKDEISNIQAGVYDQETQETKIFIKPKFSKRFLAAITGIMTPQIPTLMAVALLAALQALLVSTNAIVDASQFENVADAGLFAATMYILSKIGFSLMGVLFCISTAKYFKGNIMMAALIGLTITSRMLFSGNIIPIEEAKFGNWTSSDLAGPGWLLFKIGSFPILVKGYEGSVLPFIAAAILMVYLDKWIKSWINPTVDIVFRPFMVYTIICVVTLFVFGPALGMVEFGLSQICILFEKIPLGLGVALFAMLWQIMVLTGVHVAVIMSIMIGTLFQNPVIPTSLDIATAIGSFGQVGAAIGLIVVTRNSQLKNYTIGCLTAGMLGISEPIIYGATLPKVRPFIGGCIGAGLGGLMLGLLNIKASIVSGLGVFSITAVTGFVNQLLFILCWLVAIGGGALFTILLYSEKWDEIKFSKKQFGKINSIISKILIANGLEQKEAKEKINLIEKQYIDELENSKLIFKNYYKYFILKTKYEAKLNLILAKEEKNKRILFAKAKKLLDNEKADQEKVNEAIIKSNDYNLSSQKAELNNKINEWNIENEKVIKEYDLTIAKLTQMYNDTLKELAKISNFENIMKFENNLYNGINSVKINFGVLDEKDFTFSKEDKKIVKELLTISN